jgi:hypothetical protein
VIAGTEQRAGAALQVMIIDEHATVSEGVVAWGNQPSRCVLASPISRSAKDRPVNLSTLAANDGCRLRVRHGGTDRFAALNRSTAELVWPGARLNIAVCICSRLDHLL